MITTHKRPLKINDRVRVVDSLSLAGNNYIPIRGSFLFERGRVITIQDDYYGWVRGELPPFITIQVEFDRIVNNRRTRFFRPTEIDLLETQVEWEI